MLFCLLTIRPMYHHDMHTNQEAKFYMDYIICRYNYTVYQDTEHGRQKIVKDGVDTLISVVDSVSSSSQDFAWHQSCFDCQDKGDVVSGQ